MFGSGLIVHCLNRKDRKDEMYRKDLLDERKTQFEQEKYKTEWNAKVNASTKKIDHEFELTLKRVESEAFASEVSFLLKSGSSIFSKKTFSISRDEKNNLVVNASNLDHPPIQQLAPIMITPTIVSPAVVGNGILESRTYSDKNWDRITVRETRG